MTRTVVAAGVLLLAASCGQDPEEPAPAAPPAKPAQETKKPEAPPAPKPEPVTPPRAPAAGRAQRVAALEAKIKSLDEKRAEMEERHERERADLPRIDTRVRRRYLQLMTDARRAQHTVARMGKRLGELKKVADSAVTGKLKELRARHAGIVKRQEKIQNVWEAVLADLRLGKVADSPVKKDLDLVRAIKKQWFAASGPARRGFATSRQKKTINESFRAWLNGDPARLEVATSVLAQPRGPKKPPDRYDFTNLDFFVLLELLEDSLDRKNIAVEKKELVENRAKLALIQIELDAVEAKISGQLAQGGDELSEYEDLVARIADARGNAEYLATGVGEWAIIFKDVAAIRARHANEDDALIVELGKLRAELAGLRPLR